MLFVWIFTIIRIWIRTPAILNSINYKNKLYKTIVLHKTCLTMSTFESTLEQIKQYLKQPLKNEKETIIRIYFPSFKIIFPRRVGDKNNLNKDKII